MNTLFPPVVGSYIWPRSCTVFMLCCGALVLEKESFNDLCSASQGWAYPLSSGGVSHTKTLLSACPLQLFAVQRAQMQNFPISDQFCEIRCSSLNTRPICIILSAFERREHSKDNPRFRNAKTLFFGLGRTYREYFIGWICLNHGLHGSGTYGALWVGSKVCKQCI